MSDAFVAWIRTTVAVGVGSGLTALSTFLFNHHILWVHIDSQAATLWATGIVVTIYYTAVHWLEQHFPKAGLLLGVAKRPVYHA